MTHSLADTAASGSSATMCHLTSINLLHI